MNLKLASFGKPNEKGSVLQLGSDKLSSRTKANSGYLFNGSFISVIKINNINSDKC